MDFQKKTVRNQNLFTEYTLIATVSEKERRKLRIHYRQMRKGVGGGDEKRQMQVVGRR